MELSEAAKALDWFDFETRMRKIIHEIMTPTIKRSHEDREMVNQLKSVVVDHDKRLKPVEFALYESDQPHDAFFSKLHSKMADLEKQRILEQTKLHHEMDNLKDFVNNFQLQFEKASNERFEIVKIYFNKLQTKLVKVQEESNIEPNS